MCKERNFTCVFSKPLPDQRIQALIPLVKGKGSHKINTEESTDTDNNNTPNGASKQTNSTHQANQNVTTTISSKPKKKKRRKSKTSFDASSNTLNSGASYNSPLNSPATVASHHSYSSAHNSPYTDSPRTFETNANSNNCKSADSFQGHPSSSPFNMESPMSARSTSYSHHHSTPNNTPNPTTPSNIIRNQTPVNNTTAPNTITSTSSKSQINTANSNSNTPTNSAENFRNKSNFSSANSTEKKANSEDFQVDAVGEGKDPRLLYDGKTGHLRYLGESCTLSLLEQIRRIFRRKIGESSFTEDPERHTLVDGPSFQVALVPVQLPSKRLTITLLKAFEIYVQPTGYALQMSQMWKDIDQIYDSPVTALNSQLCLLYLAIALGGVHYTTPPMDSSSSEVAQELHQINLAAYFEGGLRYLRDSVEDGDLWVVQAYFMVALYYDVMCKRNACWIHLGIASRYAQALGMGRKWIDNSFPPEMREHRKRLFRILFLEDRLKSIYLGRPTIFSSDDIEEHVLTNPITKDDEAQIQMVKLCHIIGDIWQNVYRSKRLHSSTAQSLTVRLRAWSASFKLFARSAAASDREDRKNETVQDEESKGGLIDVSHRIPWEKLQLLNLNLTYLHGIILLTRPFLLYTSVKNRGNPENEPLKTFENLASICVQSALTSIKLMENTFQHNRHPKRSTLVTYYIFTCGVILLLRAFKNVPTEKSSLSIGISGSLIILAYYSNVDPSAKRFWTILKEMHIAISQRDMDLLNGNLASNEDDDSHDSNDGNESTRERSASGGPPPDNSHYEATTETNSMNNGNHTTDAASSSRNDNEGYDQRAASTQSYPYAKTPSISNLFAMNNIPPYASPGANNDQNGGGNNTTIPSRNSFSFPSGFATPNPLAMGFGQSPVSPSLAAAAAAAASSIAATSVPSPYQDSGENNPSNNKPFNKSGSEQQTGVSSGPGSSSNNHGSSYDEPSVSSSGSSALFLNIDEINFTDDCLDNWLFTSTGPVPAKDTSVTLPNNGGTLLQSRQMIPQQQHQQQPQHSKMELNYPEDEIKSNGQGSQQVPETPSGPIGQSQPLDYLSPDLDYIQGFMMHSGY